MLKNSKFDKISHKFFAKKSQKSSNKIRGKIKFNFAQISAIGIFVFALIFCATFFYAEKSENANAVKVANAPNAAISNGGVFYTYLKAGEILNAKWTPHEVSDEINGFSHKHSFTDFNGYVIDSVGTPVANCTLPDDAFDTTCEINYTAEEDGIYIFYAKNAGHPYSYREMSVLNSANEEISGRIWANSISFEQSGDAEFATTNAQINETFYAVNDAGNIYKINLFDYNGLSSTISLNAAGNVTENETCTSSYISTSQSSDGAAIKLGDAPVHSAAGNCTKFRLFVDGAPNADLPVFVNFARTKMNVLPVKNHAENAELKDLEPQLDPANLISNLKFTESQTSVNKSGILSFDIDPTFTGNYKVLVDVNNNGVFTDEIDREFDGSASGGNSAVNVNFDGKDGNGANISPNSVINFAIKFDRMGEIHLVVSDAEGLGGISMVLMNGESAGADKIYWNDTKLSRAGSPPAVMNETPILCADAACGGAGISSNVAGGVHGWDYAYPATLGNGQPSDENGLQMGGWGNRRNIDTWTYISSDTQSSLNAFAPSLYIVDFNTNGGNSISQQKVAYENLAKSPTPAAREHYTFAGWYLDDGTFVNNFDFATKITKNTTLHAKWTEIRWNVSFDLGCLDGEICSENPETQSVFDGNSASEPENPTHENQIFKGWQVCEKSGENSFTGENVFYDFSAKITENVELCAVWNPEFQVDFTDENGNILKSEKIENGNSAHAPNPPKKSGEKFVGWNKKFDKITGNLKVVAIYKKLCPYDFAIFADNSACVAPKENSQVPTAPNTGIFRETKYRK